MLIAPLRALSQHRSTHQRLLLAAAASASNTPSPSRTLHGGGQSAGSSGTWTWLLGGGTAAALCTAIGLNDTALADASPSAGIQELSAWLAAQGADLRGVEIASSQALSGGHGLFMSAEAAAASEVSTKKWWWPFGGSTAETLAQFPLSCAITAANVTNDPSVGRGFAWIAGQGLMDERSVIMAYLAVQKCLGGASPMAPWISALPTTFHTPLHYSALELEQLRGTPLYDGAASIRGHLMDQWEKLEPSLTVIANQARASSGVAGGTGKPQVPTKEDWLWAYSVFWSRGQALPIPTEGAASRLVASSSSNGDKDMSQKLNVIDAIIPGLDFANHHVSSPTCWWEVLTPKAPAASEKSPAGTGGNGTDGTSSGTGGTVIQLNKRKGAKMAAGQELTVSYGDKGNEELLMLFGFAELDNPHEAIIMAPPIGPSSTWDDLMHARMRLLRTLGIQPQLLLPVSALAPTIPSGTPNAKKASQHISVVPQAALDILEIFALDYKEVNMRNRLAQSAGGRDPRGTSPTADGEGTQGGVATQVGGAQHAALDMDAIDRQKEKMSPEELISSSSQLRLRANSLMVLVRMLEMRKRELEGEDGTGTLEQDEAWQWVCLVYRLGQKRLTREYVARTRAELKEVKKLIRSIEELRQKASEVPA
eukprot:gene22346-29438_t